MSLKFSLLFSFASSSELSTAGSLSVLGSSIVEATF
jgi:hypothetical protein